MTAKTAAKGGVGWKPVTEKPTKSCKIIVGCVGCESSIASFDSDDPDYLTVLVPGGWAENVPFSNFQAWCHIPLFVREAIHG